MVTRKSLPSDCRSQSPGVMSRTPNLGLPQLQRSDSDAVMPDQLQNMTSIGGPPASSTSGNAYTDWLQYEQQQDPLRPTHPQPAISASGVGDFEVLPSTAEKNEVTPRSSWEDFHGDGSSSPVRRDISPPAQSNNPFRRKSHSKDSDTDGTIYKEDAGVSPWTDQHGNLPPQARSSLNPSKISVDQANAFSANGGLPSIGPDTTSSQQSYHGLEQLVQGGGEGQTLEPGLKSPSYTGEQGRPPHGNEQVGPHQPNLQQTTDRFVSAESGPSAADRSPDLSKKLPETPSVPIAAHEDTRGTNSSHGATSKATKTTETYQIRLVNWVDASSPTNPRRSPVVVQNANGPCPLLALVNALVLTTPSTALTALIETLRVREQVSLGLLLDAVIDELMSGRRGDAAQNLPDVSDLYGFLVNLHTGMNVNPCFVSVEEEINLMDAPIDAPSQPQTFRKAGGFEETREMRLYSTFTIPLVHGWIPPKGHPAFQAIKRRARTYEDAQNILFREDELEEKLKSQGLDGEEQALLQDISSIKYFLSSTATQLTGYGLDTITETIAPGSVVILFRNDHFSTLYRHPKSGQVLTLVTDMGYARHDEVVWESLVDVSGEGSEFYSGDFRPVGNLPAASSKAAPSQADESGWTTVNRGPRNRNSTANRRTAPQQGDLPPFENLNLNESEGGKQASAEQEDHDLALAMQLQEEEEERERQESAARRRENELSQQYLDNTNSSGRRTFPGFARGASNAPNIPPRGGRLGGAAERTSTGRRAVVRQSSTDDAPPSYEQAAKGPAYHPPTDYAIPPQSSDNVNSRQRPTPLHPSRPRGASAYSEHASGFTGSPGLPGPDARSPRSRHTSYQGQGASSSRQPAVTTGADGVRKEKDCVVM